MEIHQLGSISHSDLDLGDLQKAVSCADTDSEDCNDFSTCLHQTLVQYAGFCGSILVLRLLSSMKGRICKKKGKGQGGSDGAGRVCSL